MSATLPAELRELNEQLDAAEREVHALVAGLSREQGTQRPAAGSWSVAECLDHLARANRVYLSAMQGPATRAQTRGSRRQRPALPGWIGGLFVRSLEPPARWWSRLKAPRSIRPDAVPLAEAFADFTASQTDVREFLRQHGALDLAAIRFPNPFVPGIRFSIATGLHVITAHERRHLWQARRIREELERGSRPLT